MSLDDARYADAATPCIAANGIDAHTARGLIIKTFSPKS